MQLLNRIFRKASSTNVLTLLRRNTNQGAPASVKSEQRINDALSHPDYFGVKDLITVEKLFKAHVHYGHTEGCRSHTMEPYIFGCRNGVDVINLDETYDHLIRALNFLSHVVYRGGVVLFVMHSHIFGHQVEVLAKSCGEYAHTRKYRRDVFLQHDPSNSAKLPDICVFLSLLDNVNTLHTGVNDCAKISIPTIGIADTNVDLSTVTYPIPGNDDSNASLELYCQLFKKCVLKAKELREKEICE